MSFEIFLQYCFSGITLGSIYAVVAIGFNIIYNTTGIINFAQGEFVVLGALCAITFSRLLIPVLPFALAMSIAVILAVVITTFIGGLIEIVFIKWINNPTVLRLVIITIGLSFLLRETSLHVWDEKVRALKYFTGTEVSSISLLGAHFSPQVLWVLGVTAVIVIGLGLFFRLTLTGRAMRACAASSNAARLCGINIKMMVTISFMISAAIGALAGCVTSPITQTQYNMGSSLAIKGFVVAILGGLGNSFAAVGAGLILGLLESFSIVLLPNAYRDVVAIIILLGILFFKPSGLFAKKEESALKEF
ncbi:MAG: branched-chain amino acid ABC transporter permease [Spirochaetales bacterium]|nr:branched-chain amino acid ABC transporter permease [Spirochaetales bacterium]